MHEIDLTAKVKNIIRFTLPTLILLAAIIGYAEFKYWHRSETIRLDDAKVAGTMVSVRVLTNGKVKELLFDDGAQVQAGDVIARLEVSITDEEIKQLENTVQLAKNRYAELQGGQMVKVAVQRERVTYKQVPQAPSSGSSSGNLAKLEERANRMAELFEMGAVSAVERDKARRAYENARADSSPSYSSSEPVVEYYTEYVDEFRPTPPEVLAGAEQAIKQAELSLNVARQEARETDVIAPVSGAIYYGVESETDLLAGDFVARIGDNRELWVEAEVTEEIFDKISLGKFATVTIDGKEFFGTVMEKLKPNVTQSTDDDENSEEPLELPEIPDATNKPAPLIGDNPSQQPDENSTTPNENSSPPENKPVENSASTQAQAPPEETPAPENQSAQSTETQPAENNPEENSSQTPENQTPENSSTETPSSDAQKSEAPKLPKIPAAETQAKPNDKFIIKISLPVDRDIDFKPGTAVTVEIKI
ncbi:MAG: biotin/lipoyl-binding protein [Selenomonadaceae bacterium]|nr:biotin/lipoyl-binding protein [Selenomonadaceae bacterium]